MRTLFAVCVAVSMTIAANATDREICKQLAAFETAPRALAVDHTARDWVELRWAGAWLDLDHGWHLECTHSDTDAAGRLCGWLLKNSPYEFGYYVPLQILECSGFKFPRPYPNMGLWVQSLPIFPESLRNDRDYTKHALLEIAFGGHNGDNAIRYSVFEGPAAEQKNPLPPLFSAKDFSWGD